MAESFLHKDGNHIRVEVEALQIRYGVTRATVVWWMTQCSQSYAVAMDELRRFAKDENHPDREHIAAMSAFYVKERLKS